MAHNLYSKLEGRAAMFYYGERPWHGLGTELQEPATAAEAIVAAGLDYEVKLQQMETWLPTPEGVKRVEVPDYRAVLNMENEKVLGVVGRYYRPVQNRDAFGFFDSVVGEGQAVYHTAGALGLGERIWILAKLPGQIIASGGTDDRLEKFLVLVNAHDGTSALRMFFTPIRVVCQNTLTFALNSKEKGDGIVIRHTGNIESKIRAAQDALSLSVDYYNRLEQATRSFVAHKLSSSDIESFLSTLIPDESMSDEAVEDARLTVGFLAQNGRGQKDNSEIQGSAWSYLNGATEYADFYRRGMSNDVDKGKRLASRWFGSSARFKAKAFNLLGDLVGVN